jgi:hypothetical protein
MTGPSQARTGVTQRRSNMRIRWVFMESDYSNQRRKGQRRVCQDTCASAAKPADAVTDAIWVAGYRDCAPTVWIDKVVAYIKECGRSSCAETLFLAEIAI